MFMNLKNFLLIGILITITISLSSCLKDYTCTCKHADGTVASTISATNVSKKTAEDGCNKQKTPSTTCTLAKK